MDNFFFLNKDIIQCNYKCWRCVDIKHDTCRTLGHAFNQKRPCNTICFYIIKIPHHY